MSKLSMKWVPRMSTPELKMKKVDILKAFLSYSFWLGLGTWMTLEYIYIYIYISGAETGLVLLVPGTTNNSVNVIQNGLKIIH